MKKKAIMTMAPVLALCLAGAAAAQSVQRAPAGGASQQDPAKAAQARKETARRAFAAGLKAYEAGKMAPAAQSLTTAVQSGGLSSQEMAKALYLRGVAYRKQGNSALAISDLTSAIWLKNGLSGQERSDAEENRAAAYREAGVADGGGGGSPPWARADGAKGAAPAGNWQTATAPPAQPAEPENSESGIGGFFSSLFGGSSSPSEAAPVEQPAAAAPPPEAAVPEWSNTTVTPAGTNTRGAALAAKQPPPSRVSDAKGKYRVQLATVRSREEADALAARIRAGHAGNLGEGALAVDETVVGSMGTFYRVEAGPYRTAEETGKVCQALKASGYDCLVVTR